MPKRYPLEFRRAVCARLLEGERVAEVADELGVSHQTLYLWKRQALIDAGRAEGVRSFEADELAQALNPATRVASGRCVRMSSVLLKL